MTNTMAYSPGLENVIAAQTALSKIDGQAGKFIYRGYDTTALAEAHNFEDVWYLLLHGELPDAAQRAAFIDAAFAALALPPATLNVIRTLPAEAPFMTVLRSALSTTYATWNMGNTIDLTPAQILDDCFRAAAVAPAVIAAAYRLPRGNALVEAQAGDPWAKTFLRLVTGGEPSDVQIDAVNKYMILVADHGLNASTFAARSVISTGTDVGSAIVAAVGALAGPLHGGAPSKVLEMFDEIGDAANAEAWVTEKIENKGKIMGFGHRVYKTYDPRALVLRDRAKQMGTPLAAYAEDVERIIVDTFQRLKPGRDIFTNVEYWSAVVMDAAGLPRDLFTPTFVAARTVGWAAHINEQMGNNRIMRPREEYIGPGLR